MYSIQVLCHRTSQGCSCAVQKKENLFVDSESILIKVCWDSILLLSAKSIIISSSLKLLEKSTILAVQ